MSKIELEKVKGARGSTGSIVLYVGKKIRKRLPRYFKCDLTLAKIKEREKGKHK